MSEGILAVLAVLVVVWALLSARLAQTNVTGPMVFVAAGYLLSNPDWGPLPVTIEAESARAVTELTLALLLFTDASRVRLVRLEQEASLPVRLLGIGLPLSVVAGTAGTLVVLGLPWTLALFVGAALAPTDAALSTQVINDKRVPHRLRQALNVESGLNDGIAAPVVTIAVALTAADLGLDPGGDTPGLVFAVRELLVGGVIGLLVGTLGALAVNTTTRRAWTTPGSRRIAVFALPVAAYTVAQVLDGNGFIAAFVAGLLFGSLLDKREVVAERSIELPELFGELLALVAWFLFGASLIPLVLGDIDAAVVGYALLSLTVFRMLPVAVSLIGAGLPASQVGFLGWFGPRGMASVVFALLALSELEAVATPAVDTALAVVALTVLLSVVLHGVTAGPAARRFGPAPSPEPTSPRARTEHLRPRPTARNGGES